MKATLKDIAAIQTGVFAQPTLKGDVVYLQSKHFNQNGELKFTPHPDLKWNEMWNKGHMLNPGDVLFSAKGTKNFAAMVTTDFPSSLASTSFFVIRRVIPQVRPEYLAWYLNQPGIIQSLKAEARGTSIPSISKVTLGQLEISIPSLESQEAILQIARLRNEEKKLKQQIEALRDKQIQQQIINAIK